MEGREFVSRAGKGDDLLVEALGKGRTQVQAAAFAGVSERTVRRRLEDPDFAARVRDARAEFTRAAAAQLGGLYEKAIGVLNDSLEDGDGKVRLRAAQVVLKTGPEFRAHGELEERLLALEEHWIFP